MSQFQPVLRARNSTLDKLDNLRVAETIALISPADLHSQLPVSARAAGAVSDGRRAVEAVLTGQSQRFLVLTGPCSIHDPKAALEYGEKLLNLQSEMGDELLLVMRVYFEKPRTVIGWKGLINDPHLDGSYDMGTGLFRARKLLLQLSEMGVFCATEFLDPIAPQYVADLITWAAVGARTTESQTHREMASGLSMPVGFKNGTDGDLQTALDALQAAASPHAFLGIDENGQTCIVKTTGNPHGHLVLRGGRSGTNFDENSVGQAARRLREVNLPDRLIVDCSHANSGKDAARQGAVLQSVWYSRRKAREIGQPYPAIGAMLESHLFSGAQKLGNLDDLQYGVSITDACLGWAQTRELFAGLR